ncbi:MAG TPA: biopolymer transporter ExbD [Terriglobales bacterium]|nr:biopolymer transporter ExbD [Terriglobales bacterium]
MLYNRANSQKLVCQIDVAALGSVMLVIVFTIMIWETDAYSPHHGVAVDLPRVRHPVDMPRAKREDASIVSIMRDGKIFFGHEQVAVDQLPLKIDGRLAQSGEKKVYIQADYRVRYANVKSVLDAVRSAGVDSVGILVAR